MGISQQIGASSLIKAGVCTSATRPATPYEGQLIYETDTDMMTIWNGTAWRYVASTTATNGTVLQVQAYSITGQTVVAGTTWTTLASLSGTITPKSSTSKVLVSVVISSYATSSSGTGNAGLGVRLLRDGSVVLQPGPADSGGSYQLFSAAGGNIAAPITIQFLDSPNTTSTVTYSLQGHSYGATMSAYFNAAAGVNAAKCVITLMEIAG